MKRKELFGILCDKRMSVGINDKAQIQERCTAGNGCVLNADDLGKQHEDVAETIKSLVVCSRKCIESYGCVIR